ncbi:tRNA lysidine(34) synthetase TilS [Salibacterium aidingense]|uniref:tRNA lysidine(34) synthetase TilS n=1 Tax=Salibacterium aidingense TaxID=384933 RepID=UPI00040DE682|nr:tRNA lysidine(34) synthetase TilS [Salibacterium aidingense]
MKHTVEQWIKERSLIDPGSRILVAVSGGPDSMALLHFMKEKEKAWNLQVLAAHVNHGLREETAEEDEVFVQSWCKTWSIPFFRTYVSVKKEIAEKGGSIQERARQLRYNYLADVMKQEKVSILATGHHADDQVETMLMKQVSGRALLGDPAMKAERPFSSGKLIRPLLGVTKEDILQYCRTQKIPYQIDESNTSDKYTRNRIRQQILPALKEEDPRMQHHFQQYADWLADERAYLERRAEQKWKQQILYQDEHSVTISVNGVKALPLPLQRRGIHLILKYLCIYFNPELSVVHIDQFLALLQQDHPSFSLDWPGNICVKREYDTVTFFLNSNKHSAAKREAVELAVPGETVFGDYVFTADPLQSEDFSEATEHTLICKPEQLTFPLIVRPRQEGDRIRPLGMKGSKKVNRIFIEKKIPRAQRVNWPVVVDAQGTVVWVPLLKKSWRQVPSRTWDEAPFLRITCRKL